MNSFKITFLIVLLGLGLGACQDFLTPTPDNNYTKDRFYKDPVWALGLLINSYSNSAFPRSYLFDEVATDDAVSNNPGDPYLKMAAGEWSSLSPYPNNVWGAAYNTITNMNLFLTIVDQVQWSWQDAARNELFRKRYTGEAYGFRGFYYHRLLQQFGGKGTDGKMYGVPLTNEVSSALDDWKVQRSTYAETVQEVLNDYNKGISLMPYRYQDIQGQTSWNQVNGAVANRNLLNGERLNALKARFYLMAGSPAYTESGNYNPAYMDSAAHVVARLVTYNGGLAASVGPDIKFWDKDDDITNADVLWRNDFGNSNSLEYNNFPQSQYGSGRVNPTQNLVNAFPMKNGYPIDDPSSGFDAANPYSNRDPRLAIQIIYNGASFKGKTISTQEDATGTAANDGLNKLPLYSTRTGYYLRKLLREDTNLTPGKETSLQHIYPLIRWTEMLLIYAEAENELNGPNGDAGIGSVKAVIAAIRTRAGITPDNYLASITSKEQMRELIRNERRIELSFEGFRFWDLRRWNVPLDKLNEAVKGVAISGTSPKTYDYLSTGKGINPVEARNYSSYMYYGPIPYQETKKYPGFVQNAGW
jgi:hypothetical protein